MHKFNPLKIDSRMFFDWRRITEEDKPLAWEIESNLSSVANFGNDFGSAVQLFEFALAQSNALWTQTPLLSDIANLPDSMPFPEAIAKMNEQHRLRDELKEQIDVYRGWQFIAARDGAVTVYNFGRSMEGVRAALKKCPSLNAFVDQDLLSEATRILRRRFPRFEAFRHMISHYAEFSQTEEAMGEHATIDAIDNSLIRKSEGGAEIFIGPSLNGRELITTFEGKALSYEISLESFEHLKKSALTFFSAFMPAGRPQSAN